MRPIPVQLEYNVSKINANFKVTVLILSHFKKKLEPEPGFEPRTTSRFLALLSERGSNSGSGSNLSLEI